MDGTSVTDGIRNLPCDVVDHIFKYLPLRDAVRTSILSKWWRNRWVTIPYLVFDQNFKRSLHRDCNIESIIYQVLALHKGPIVKFTYWYYQEPNSSNAVVYHCLHFLSNHRIQELNLYFPASGIDQPVPHHLFAFCQLRYLRLFNCKLRPPSEFQGFDRLVTLQLSNVLTEPRDLRRFTSKCPMLKHLVLSSYSRTTLGDLEIDAPNLKSLTLYFWHRLPSICFKSASLLEKVFIYFHGCTSLEILQSSQSNMIELFGQLASIKQLQLCCGSLQLLATGGVMQKLTKNLTHPTVFRLWFRIDFVTIAEVTFALCLIRSSPNLQSLHIQSNSTRAGDVRPAVQFLKQQQNYEVTLSHLKNVKICGFSSSEPEMEFVKLLLSAATTLKKLELVLSPHLTGATEEGYRMLKTIARFRRASSKAEIII